MALPCCPSASINVMRTTCIRNMRYCGSGGTPPRSAQMMKKRVAGMTDGIDFDALLGRYKRDPFEYVDVFAIHTGRITFKVVEGEEVSAPSGQWLQVPGSALYAIERERNPKIIAAHTSGTVERINTEFDGQFVEAGEQLMTIKHPLKKKEIIDLLERTSDKCQSTANIILAIFIKNA